MLKTLVSALLLSLTFMWACQFAVTEHPLTTIYLVRHAEKIEDGSKDPDLTAQGQDRANYIKNLFAEAELHALYATPFKRTQSTLLPLADTLGLEIQTYAADQPINDFISDILERHKAQHLFIAGHSNTIPAMLNVLLDREEYQTFDHQQYEDVFIVTLSTIGNASLTRLQIPLPPSVQ